MPSATKNIERAPPEHHKICSAIILSVSGLVLVGADVRKPEQAVNALSFTEPLRQVPPRDTGKVPLGSGLNYVHQIRISASVTATWKFLARLS